MPPDIASQNAGFFATKALIERQKLFLHLLQNTDNVLYLRGPNGAGKSQFVEHLFDELTPQMAVLEIKANANLNLIHETMSLLGLDADERTQWPACVFAATIDHDLLVVIDDADALSNSAIEDLVALQRGGAHLILMGRGGMAPAGIEMEIQFIDLPPFEPEESARFLRTHAGDKATLISDDLAMVLHRAASGMPGPLLDALREFVARGAGASASSRPAPGRLLAAPLAKSWLVGGVVVALLLVVLWNQDTINAFFEPEPDDTAHSAGDVVETESGGSEPQVGAVSSSVDVRLTIPALPPEQNGSIDERADALPPLPVPEVSLAQLPPNSATEPEAAKLPPSAAPDVTPEPDIAVAEDIAGDISKASEATGDDPLDAVLRDALSATEPDAVPATPPRPTAPLSMPADYTTPAVVAQPPQPAPVEAKATEAVAPSLRDTPSIAQTDQSVTIEESHSGAVVEVRAGTSPPAGSATNEESSADEKEVVESPSATQRQPSPAPVEDRLATTSKQDSVQDVRVVAEQPKVKAAETNPAPAEPIASVSVGSEWLSSRTPSHYTLQLVGGRDRGPIEEFIRQNNINPPFAIFSRNLNGQAWYSLVAGDYVDRSSAIAARERLPKDLQSSGVWPRTFESIAESQ